MNQPVPRLFVVVPEAQLPSVPQATPTTSVTRRSAANRTVFVPVIAAVPSGVGVSAKTNALGATFGFLPDADRAFWVACAGPCRRATSYSRHLAGTPPRRTPSAASA